ncbi:hypothetical protein [Kitasatospora sp. NPDC059571]|uniref:hypothetical protein n=1 Tax=Kitasatospora sp. NPDC059571 TaxID=3346871 RepID=UPI00367FE9F8
MRSHRTAAPVRAMTAVLVALGGLSTVTGCGSTEHPAAQPVQPAGPATSTAPADRPAAPPPSAAPTASDGARTTAAAAPTPTGSAAPGRPAATPGTGAAQRLPAGRLTVAGAAQVTASVGGLAQGAVLHPGTAATEFTVTVRNTGSADYTRLAAVVRVKQYDGGLAPLGSVGGTLERYDEAAGAWHAVALPQASGMDYLLAASDGAPLARGASLTIRYRIRLAEGLRPGATDLQFTAVSQPENLQAGTVSVPVAIA